MLSNQLVKQWDAAMTAGATAGISNFFLGASLNALFGIINMVQVYVHLPLFDIDFPANVQSIAHIFIGIA
jgi:hypothetical protein